MTDQLQNLMAQTEFSNLNHLLSTVVADQFDDRDWIAEPKSFTFNGNSNWNQKL